MLKGRQKVDGPEVAHARPQSLAIKFVRPRLAFKKCFFFWQTMNQSRKCPPRYFSDGLDDRIAFASDDPPLKNGRNFKVVKVPGYLCGLRGRFGTSLCGRPATSCSVSSPYGASEPNKPKSGWNLIMAASLEFIDAATPRLWTQVQPRKKPCDGSLSLIPLSLDIPLKICIPWSSTCSRSLRHCRIYNKGRWRGNACDVKAVTGTRELGTPYKRARHLYCRINCRILANLFAPYRFSSSPAYC
ncbi:hypothetical protein ACQKWADRAFT_303891 [Trichoderma austrokoningii]